jgi:hypothetical protein
MRRGVPASAFWGGIALGLLLILTFSTPIATGLPEKVGLLTSNLKFDFFTWTLNAAWVKLQQASIGMPAYIGSEHRKRAVLDYLQVTRDLEEAEHQLDQIYADPAITDKETTSADLRRESADLLSRQQQLAPIAEGVLQAQVAEILGEQGLTADGQPIPAVMYHTSATPNFLVLSAREQIGTLYNTSLVADMTVDQMQNLETGVDQDLRVSSLVVPTGGIGAYPTMIMRTSDLRWLAQVISHEWTHNYLYWHPLGSLYEKSPQLRTMNETTADIVGKEIGRRVIERYYPEYAGLQAGPKQVAPLGAQAPRQPSQEPPAFDFRREMHQTRVTADQLLAEGRVAQAEAYMEKRRQLFWENGYAIRKLNQAYFAFYGSYADVPGGAAGEDPVGPAVRALRRQSGSLAEFVDRMAGLTSFEALQEAIEAPSN